MMSKDRQNILYINGDSGIPLWGSSGGSIHIREFVQALKNAHYNPTVITSSFENSGPAPNIPLTIIPQRQSERLFELDSGTSEERQVLRESKHFYQNAALESLLRETCAETNYEIIYERYSLFSFAARSYAAEANIPYILEVNAPLIPETLKHRKLELVDLARQIERYLFSSADQVVAVSLEVMNYIHEVAPDAKVSVLPNAVNLSRFNGNLSDGGATNTFDIDSDDFVIGFLGSLKPWHGLENLLDAFGDFSRANAGSHLMIIGDSRRLRPELEKRCKSLGIEESVTFTGLAGYEDAPNYLNRCDALVAPYPALDDFYFSPLKVFEYMAAGKAIVASDIGQVSETLSHEETALLVPPGDNHALSSALKQLKSDPDLRRRLGKAARSEALSRHTWDIRIAQISKIFNRLTHEKQYA